MRYRPSTVMTGFLAGQALARSDTLARSELYSATVAALIDAEAMLTRQRQWHERQLAHLWGATTVSERRERTERRERAELGDPTQTRHGRVGRRPVVFWHESGQGPLLLLLNGWSASGLVWPSAWLERLEARYRVVRIDNRGTGWSRTAPAPFTLAGMADDAAAVLATLDARPAVVVGLSMGGMLAQELALRSPRAVERLVLAGTRPPAPAAIPAPAAVLARTFAAPAPGEDVPSHVRDAWGDVTGPGFPERHPELMDELVGQVLTRRTPRVAVDRQMRAIAAWHGPGRLKRITVPTTVVHGSVDPLVPVGNGMRLAQLIPGARYLELPGVGHLVPLEAPHELASVIEGTLDGVTASP